MDNSRRNTIERIISGGQTGVDRAALDVALLLGIAHGGYCPRHRRAEDGRIPARYMLQETPERDYTVRTRLNVQVADGTLILHRGPLSGGTLLTRQITIELAKPMMAVDLQRPCLPAFVWQWIDEFDIHVLNVAGPRESTSRGIYRQAFDFLQSCLVRE